MADEREAIADQESLDIVRLLIVEDNPGDVHLLERLIAALDSPCSVGVASTLAEALRALDGARFDLVISDLGLPDAAGLEAVVRIRNVAAETPLIILTGSEGKDAGLQSVSLGAQDYLVKDRLDRCTLHKSIQYSVERKRCEQEMLLLSNYDQLPNRSVFQRAVKDALAAWRSGAVFGVMLIDLDRFKPINDTFGHHVGDEVLRQVAKRLKETLRESDVPARFGGDEFACLITNISSVEDAIAIARRLLSSLRKPYRVEDRTVSIGASVGIALCPEAGTSYGRLLKSADSAMYRAKSSDRYGFRVFGADEDRQEIPEIQLEAALERALQKQQFLLHYQPQLNLSTGATDTLEALIRWRRHGTLLPPRQFLGSLEQTGLIKQVGRWTLRSACQHLFDLRACGSQYERMTVNLSAAQFEHPGLAEDVAWALEVANLPPACLELELTETVLTSNPERIEATLRTLKRLGVGIVLDDFGKGYSSLAYLSKIPVDVLKIDQSFVQGALDDPSTKRAMEAIVALGKSLGLLLVAEGVETLEQLQFAKEQGCHRAQGYLEARPMSQEATLKWTKTLLL